MVDVLIGAVDDDRFAILDFIQRGHDARLRHERAVATEAQLPDTGVVLHGHDGALRVFVEHEGDAYEDADDHALEQVEREDRGDRDPKRQQLGDAELDLSGEERGLAEIQADLNEHGREAGERNAIEQWAREEHGTEQQQAMHKRREALTASRRYVGATTHDDRGHRKAAEQTGDRIRRTLRQQFAIRRAVTLERVEAVDGLQGQQCFDAGDHGDRRTGDPRGRTHKCGPLRARQRIVQRADATQRYVHEVARLEGERRRRRQCGGHTACDEDGHERRRDQFDFRQRRVLPAVQNRQRYDDD